MIMSKGGSPTAAPIRKINIKQLECCNNAGQKPEDRVNWAIPSPKRTENVRPRISAIFACPSQQEKAVGPRCEPSLPR